MEYFLKEWEFWRERSKGSQTRKRCHGLSLSLRRKVKSAFSISRCVGSLKSEKAYANILTVTRYIILFFLHGEVIWSLNVPMLVKCVLLFDACIKGFNYRQSLSLDDTFLKEKFKGCLFSATEKDVDNGKIFFYW